MRIARRHRTEAVEHTIDAGLDAGAGLLHAGRVREIAQHMRGGTRSFRHNLGSGLKEVAQFCQRIERAADILNVFSRHLGQPSGRIAE